MKWRLKVWLVALAPLASPSMATEPPAAMADVHRLSAGEVQAILDDAAARREASSVLPARRIEGELGIGIGTGGYREAFGTAVVPVGKTGTAILSFDGGESDYDQRHRRR